MGAALGSIIAKAIAPHIDAVMVAAEKPQIPSGCVAQSARNVASHEPPGVAVSSPR